MPLGYFLYTSSLYEGLSVRQSMGRLHICKLYIRFKKWFKTKFKIFLSDGYVVVSIPQDGSAHATSIYSPDWGPKDAFRVYQASTFISDQTYWCSRRNPQKPVSLWFQFTKPTCVTKIKFEEKYKLPSGKEYVVKINDISLLKYNIINLTQTATGLSFANSSQTLYEWILSLFYFSSNGIWRLLLV